MKELRRSFPGREKYLEFFVEQLNKRQFAPIWFKGKVLWLDYRRIYIPGLCNHKSWPVVPLTGWGSGWEGIAPLAFSLACEGKEVILPSFPGYGNSHNPPACYFKENFFENSAEALIAFLLRLEMKKIILVGHSMGGQIAAKVARIHPDLVEKLILISPSGVGSCDFWEGMGLARRFVKSGIQLRRWHKEELGKAGGKYYLQSLIDICNQQRSPFGWGRLRQRFYEWRAICQGGFLEDLKKVQCPVGFIGGTDDAVFPASSDMWEISRCICRHNFSGTVFDGLPHNPTLFHSEIVAKEIASWIREKEGENGCNKFF